MSRQLIRGTSVAVAALVSLAAAGCQRAAPQQPAAQGAAAPAAKAAKKPSSLKTLTLTHPGAAKAVVGTAIDATAEGLPPGRKLDLLWQTVNGGWVVEDYYHFRGKKFTETTRSLGQFETGDDGRLAAHFTIPEDYGGVHEVIVSDNGAPLAQGGIEVTQTFEMHPARRTGRHADRAPRQGPRLADDGEHVGDQLGQPGSRAGSRRPTRAARRSRASERAAPSAITSSRCSPATWARATSITSRRRTRTCRVPRSPSA